MNSNIYINKLKHTLDILWQEMSGITGRDSLLFLEALMMFCIIVLAGFLLSYLTMLLLNFIKKRQLKPMINSLIDAACKPIMIYIIIRFSVSAVFIINKGFSHKIVDIKNKDLEKAIDITEIVTFTWFLIIAAKSIEQYIVEKKFDSDHAAQSMIKFLFLVSKIVILAVSVVNLLIVVGFNVKTTLTLGGLGSVAIGFASKDLVANFFGAVMIHLDRPYIIGDDISMPMHSISGIIEKISWRLTTIRQYNRIPVYVPNSIFASSLVENRSRKTHRLLDEYIKIRYNKTHQLKNIVESIRKIIFQDNAVDNTQSVISCITNIGKTVFEMRLYFLVHTTDFVEASEARQHIIMSINKILRTVHNTYMVFSKANIEIFDETQTHKVLKEQDSTLVQDLTI
ncbi:putative Mechanosensitive ion channel protein MscS [Candidatus Xenohaliotis californiensis]|uniref:Mechanosensitive ion channel protein MscS n=1 Tax=Candidatus Xenohaliotis californiensis TaxID=84677 RepID=A0ABM9N7L7_9RICK|nr:putative Mechanosensitive ion channel protein MscS [Candidatus Xenohaliotis californiensis]